MSFSKAMNALAPNAVWTAHNNVITDWQSSDIEQPTAKAIADKIAEIESERSMELLRDARNTRLVETDVWALSDRTMTQAQIDYRQALRDITDNYTSLDDVQWPEMP